MAAKKKQVVKVKRHSEQSALRRTGPIDPKAFLAWLKKRGACDLGLAECKARLHLYRQNNQPVEVMLVAAISSASMWWPTLSSYAESMPFTPSYLKYLARVTGGRYDDWQAISRTLTRANIRKAMKRDGVRG